MNRKIVQRHRFLSAAAVWWSQQRTAAELFLIWGICFSPQDFYIWTKQSPGDLSGCGSFQQLFKQQSLLPLRKYADCKKFMMFIYGMAVFLFYVTESGSTKSARERWRKKERILIWKFQFISGFYKYVDQASTGCLGCIGMVGMLGKSRNCQSQCRLALNLENRAVWIGAKAYLHDQKDGRIFWCDLSDITGELHRCMVIAP